MEIDINTLIPIGTFVIGAAWTLLVVLVEHLSTSREKSEGRVKGSGN